MPTVQHSTLTGADSHEPKGVSTAPEGTFYVSDGAGSGSWKYIPTGWGQYKDAGSPQVFNTTAARLQNDGASVSSVTDHLPFEIRGTGQLWDTTNDKITPVSPFDTYNIRLDLPVTAKSGAPSSLKVVLDIGGAAGITIPIVSSEISVNATPPYTLSAGFTVYTGTTFKANGGQFFLSSDTGTVTVTNPSIIIDMSHNGDL